MKKIEVVCPKCGNRIAVDSDKTLVICEECGCLILDDELAEILED